jgi:hypothetical protein
MNPVAIEAMILPYIQSDISLVAEASGGIYAFTALTRSGINRETTPSAFNGTGYLLPLVVLRARAPVPDSRIFDEQDKTIGQNQTVEFWMYQWVGYDIIEIMGNCIHRLLQGHSFPGYWPAEWTYVTGPLIDEGSLKGASMVHRDYLFRNIKVAV